MKANKKRWQIACERYVAVIDIMGFKDMIARTSDREVYKLMKIIATKRKLIERIDFDTEEMRGMVRSVTYSDSIMIYSKDDSVASLEVFLGAVTAFSTELLHCGVPHRGAVAFGNMTLDYSESIYFGQPLIDAHLLQEELAFYGVVLHATAERRITEERSKGTTSRLFGILVRYKCPFKTGSAIHETVAPIHPSIHDASDLKQYKSAKFQEGMKEIRLRTSGGLRRYVDNTVEYHKLLEKVVAVVKGTS